MAKNILYGLVIIAILMIPFVASSYILTISILVLISMGLASSLNIVVGFTGQISFAHAAFYGIGAYSSALLSLNFNLNFWVSLVFATLITGLIGALLGIPSLRLKGQYLAIATIGFQEIVMILMLQWESLTKGPAGITGIPRPSFFGFLFTNTTIFYLGFILLAVVIFVSLGLLRSKLGLQMIAVREDEEAAQAMGVNITKIKILAFTISSALAGALGSFYAHFIGTIDPNVFNIMLSATILVMLLGGGIGTVLGPLVGAFILETMPEVLRSIDEYRMVAYGLVLILIILFMPEGIVGLIKNKFKDRKNKTPGGENVAS